MLATLEKKRWFNTTNCCNCERDVCLLFGSDSIRWNAAERLAEWRYIIMRQTLDDIISGGGPRLWKNWRKSSGRCWQVSFCLSALHRCRLWGGIRAEFSQGEHCRRKIQNSKDKNFKRRAGICKHSQGRSRTAASHGSRYDVSYIISWQDIRICRWDRSLGWVSLHLFKI